MVCEKRLITCSVRCIVDTEILKICLEFFGGLKSTNDLTRAKNLFCKHHLITINQTVNYMAWGFMIFMRGVDITRGIGRVLLKVEPVLGPEIAQA